MLDVLLEGAQVGVRCGGQIGAAGAADGVGGAQAGRLLGESVRVGRRVDVLGAGLLVLLCCSKFHENKYRILKSSEFGQK